MHGIQAPHFVRCSIPDMRISLGEFFFEHCEAIERHKVPLEFLIAEGV
jgi:hypothetical protein